MVRCVDHRLMCFATTFTVSKLWMHTCKTTSQAVQKLVRRKNPCAWTGQWAIARLSVPCCRAAVSPRYSPTSPSYSPTLAPPCVLSPNLTAKARRVLNSRAVLYATLTRNPKVHFPPRRQAELHWGGPTGRNASSVAVAAWIVTRTTHSRWRFYTNARRSVDRVRRCTGGGGLTPHGDTPDHDERAAAAAAAAASGRESESELQTKTCVVAELETKLAAQQSAQQLEALSGGHGPGAATTRLSWRSGEGGGAPHFARCTSKPPCGGRGHEAPTGHCHSLHALCRRSHWLALPGSLWLCLSRSRSLGLAWSLV